jgi:Holliday junction DNA helicase RuvA
MIALLSGTIASRNDPFIIIDVHGVGYKVYASHTILSRLPAVGDPIKIHTYTHVREDILELYGFAQSEDLRLFEYLISVSGVGPKTAIGVFAVGSRNDIVKAIVSNDVTFFTAVPRLGKKNAQKLIIELKGKLGSTQDFDMSATDVEEDDVIVALKAFGFSTQEAVAALRSVDIEGLTVSEKVKMALKHLGK